MEEKIWGLFPPSYLQLAGCWKTAMHEGKCKMLQEHRPVIPMGLYCKEAAHSWVIMGLEGGTQLRELGMALSSPDQWFLSSPNQARSQHRGPVCWLGNSFLDVATATGSCKRAAITSDPRRLASLIFLEIADPAGEGALQPCGRPWRGSSFLLDSFKCTFYFLHFLQHLQEHL